jgi:signal peptidase II
MDAMSDSSVSPRPVLPRVWPFVAAALIIAADQWTKALVAASIPVDSKGWSWGGDFFELIHQKNTGVAFSLGNGLPAGVRHIVFIVLPVLILAAVAVYIWVDKTLTLVQRWSLGLILGGGLGNIIDRIFRPDGVIDFLSFNMYGFLGMPRFATFNVADAAVSVGGVLFVLSLLLGRRRK